MDYEKSPMTTPGASQPTSKTGSLHADEHSALPNVTVRTKDRAPVFVVVLCLFQSCAGCVPRARHCRSEELTFFTLIGCCSAGSLGAHRWIRLRSTTGGADQRFRPVLFRVSSTRPTVRRTAPFGAPAEADPLASFSDLQRFGTPDATAVSGYSIPTTRQALITSFMGLGALFGSLAAGTISSRLGIKKATIIA